MSRYAKPFVPGTKLGHWLILAHAGTVRRHGDQKSARQYLCLSDCGKEEVRTANVINNSRNSATCHNCRNTPRGAEFRAAFVRDATGDQSEERGPRKMRIGVMHRCQVLTHGPRAPTLRCGAVVRAGERADHLREVHRIDSQDPAAAFGPALNDKEAV